MCALASQPLVSVCPAYNLYSLHVRPCLDAPLTKQLDRRELLALVLAADAAAERAEKVQGASQSTLRSIARVQAVCQRHRPGQAAADTLAELGMLGFVPHLERQLRTSHHQQQQQQATSHAPGASYLAYVSLLNQAVMMSTQLYNDATNPSHHKYAAHQVALLYQALNMLQGETKPIRRHIEARFDEIKSITESSHPYLDMELSSWLQTVTWVCRQEVIVCPEYVHKRVQPLLQHTKAAH